MSTGFDSVRPLRWHGDALEILDQRQLPQRVEYIRAPDAQTVARAIHDMAVRGAPAIGIAAAYGVVLAARARYASDPAGWQAAVETDLKRLEQARPTAVNLRWALERMRKVIAVAEDEPTAMLAEQAQRLHADDVRANRTMGELGAALLNEGGGVLTHCNTGSLATGGYGTALGVIRSAFARGGLTRVFAGETRPWLQGARLTAWELVEDGIPVELIADGAAAALMQHGLVEWVVVGADRVAANGDAANKIGTLGLAVAARHFGAKLMVVVPTSTIDLDTLDGTAIPIETRAADELLGCGGARVAAEGAGAWNPVFDVTPAELIDAIVTEHGVVRQPTRAKLEALMRGGAQRPA